MGDTFILRFEIAQFLVHMQITSHRLTANFSHSHHALSRASVSSHVSPSALVAIHTSSPFLYHPSSRPFTPLLPTMDPQCTTCGLPSAHACPSCASYPSASDLTQPRTVGYCSSACEIAHIPLHNTECVAARLRRLVVLLAEPLEEALLAYAAVTNELPVRKVRRRGKRVVELRLDWSEGKVPKMFEPSGTYYTFPDKDMQKLDKRTRQGVLMVNRCADVSCLVMPVLRKVLGPGESAGLWPGEDGVLKDGG